MKQFLFFAGLPGTGKSTISKAVAKRVKATIVDIDTFKRIYADPDRVKTEIDPPDIRWRCYEEAFKYAIGLFGQGVPTVIVDEVFHLNSLRTQLEVLCVHEGVKVLWAEVQCPYEVVAKRLQSKEREGHILSTQEALDMYCMFQRIFEPFSIKSNHVVIDNGGDVDICCLVDEVLRRV